jgi:hypothetical protein
MQGEAQVRANDDGTIADFLAAARAAATVGDPDRAHAICVNLYRRLFASDHSLFASEHSYVDFVNMLLREGLAGTAETLVRDFTLALQRAGQTEAQEALLGDAISWFADNPLFATEYALLANQREDYEKAAYRWEAVRSRWPDRAPRSLPVPATNDKAFANIVADLDVDEATFRREMLRERPSDRNYIIVFTPRSGSTWLTSILATTQLLGQPQEYINPAFVTNVVKEMNSKDPSGLLAILRRRRKSANGVFGIKAQAQAVSLSLTPIGTARWPRRCGCWNGLGYYPGSTASPGCGSGAAISGAARDGAGEWCAPPTPTCSETRLEKPDLFGTVPPVDHTRLRAIPQETAVFVPSAKIRPEHSIQ